MVKIKVTEREIKGGYRNIITIDYFDAHYLLRYQDADFYTCGAYGWKSDIYKINNNTIISTGYSPVNGIRNYDLTRKYDEKARKIVYNDDLSYEEQKKKVNKLLEKYIKEILESEV